MVRAKHTELISMGVVSRILDRLNPVKGYKKAEEKDKNHRYPLR